MNGFNRRSEAIGTLGFYTMDRSGPGQLIADFASAAYNFFCL